MSKIPSKKTVILITAIFFLAAVQTTCVTSPMPESQSPLPYFTGSGGSGTRIAVLEPTGRGLAVNEQWVLPLIQGTITGDFNKFSAMTIIDRQNLEKILAEQTLSSSGYFSDEDYISIGKLTNARFILTGIISRTANTYMLEFAVTDAETGERKASYPPRSVDLAAIENLSAMKEASTELLTQLGVELTISGLTDLKKTTALTQVQAETALAKGITAEKRGTEVTALSYYFQAAALDPWLFEAVNRSSVIHANITSGNIRLDAQNDIQWRREWIKILTETEEYLDDLFKTNPLPYTLFYYTNIIQSEINYEDETITLGINTNLRGSGFWKYTVNYILLTVYDGLLATNRKEAWGFADWPMQSITGIDIFKQHRKEFSIGAELVNNNEKIIANISFQAVGQFEFNFESHPSFIIAKSPNIHKDELDSHPRILVSNDDIKPIYFSGINVDDITDSLYIRIKDVNGSDGIVQIKALTENLWETYNRYTVENSIITGYSGREKNIQIPNIWDEAVIGIGDRAFYWKFLTDISIPNGVIFIGKEAFKINWLRNVIIPDSVTYLGDRSFEQNNITNVIIPNNVTYFGENIFSFLHYKLRSITIGNNAPIKYDTFGIIFYNYYLNNGKKAGTYENRSQYSSQWSYIK